MVQRFAFLHFLNKPGHIGASGVDRVDERLHLFEQCGVHAHSFPVTCKPPGFSASRNRAI